MSDTARKIEAAYNDTAMALGILGEALTKKRIKRGQMAIAKDLLLQAAKALT